MFVEWGCGCYGVDMGDDGGTLTLVRCYDAHDYGDVDVVKDKILDQYRCKVTPEGKEHWRMRELNSEEVIKILDKVNCLIRDGYKWREFKQLIE